MELSSRQRLLDPLSQQTAGLLRRKRTSYIARALVGLETALDGTIHSISNLRKAQRPSTHESERLEHANGVGETFACNVRRGSRHRLIHAHRETAISRWGWGAIDLGRSEQAKGSWDDRRQIAEDVAEELSGPRRSVFNIKAYVSS